MNSFTEYLYNLGYASQTLKQCKSSFKIFNEWISLNKIPEESFNYNHLLEFIDHSMLYFRPRSNPRSSVNRLLVAVSHYYEYLKLKNPDINNPVKTVRVKNRDHKLVHDLLHESDLKGLYDQLEPTNPRLVRNKVILGLMVFQGVTTGELHRLTMQDLRLRKGSVFINGEKGTNFRKGSTSRELPLMALQIIDLMDYLENIRPRILAGSYRSKPGRKPEIENVVSKTDQLLLSLGGSDKLKNSLLHLFRNLKQNNPQVKNSTQIRQSVIASWLNKYDLRQVQYMAGHRFVSSTDYYKQVNLEILKQKVNAYHPLK